MVTPEATMNSLTNDIEAFRRQLAKGSIQKAYRALVFFMFGLRTHFQRSEPGYAVSGLYQGYLDMTYFALFPPALKRRGLKIAFVFNYDAFRFEAWLSGRNRGVMDRYLELFRDLRPAKYRLAKLETGMDSIVECDLVQAFDLADPDALTAQIETATAAFIADMQRFVGNRPAR
jgi:hypothetical protein